MTVKDMKEGVIKDTVDHITEDAVKNSSTNIIEAGTPIVATRMSLGKIVTTAFDVAINQDLKALRLSSCVYRDYFIYCYKHSSEIVQSLGTGTTVKGIRLETLKALVIPVPPLPEQKVIAEKLDSLLAQVESTKTRLESIPGILRQFRQSVLAAAVSGELTEDWREEHGKILDFKKCLFGDLLVELRNGLSPKPNEEAKGFPILRINAVRSGQVSQNDIRHLECDTNTLKKYRLETGDLLFTRYNGSLDFVGVCGLIRDLQYENLLYPDKLIRVRVHKSVLAKYVEIYFASPKARDSMVDCVKTTSGQKGISGQDIKSQAIKVPPIEEQEEIVRRVEELFGFADKVAAQVKTAMESVNHLTQSILAQAFSGELTKDWREQNPDLISGENSAAALLERIKAERAKLKPAPQPRELTKKATKS
jgi:type I restriction enzyme S subunit